MLAHIARTRTISGDRAGGLELARNALAFGEALGLEDVRAHALASVGLAKTYLGDPTGREDELRALEIAIAANSPVAGSIANNVAVNAFFALDFRRAAELTDEGLRIAERFGDAAGVRFLRAQRTSFTLFRGDWDTALVLADDFIAECETSPHYMETRALIDRGEIRLGRGDPEGAYADFERALALVRSMSDPQAIIPVVASAVSAFATGDRTNEARRLLAEVTSLMLEHPMEGVIEIAMELAHLDLAREHERELRTIVDRSHLPRWRDAARAALDRDFVHADMWAEAGSPTIEARLRLRAAKELVARGQRSEGEAQAEQGLEFYRSVGATFFVARAEKLLAAPAAQSESA